MSAQPFWQTKNLQEMTQQEWESLCDGCGKCCLQKLENEDDGGIYYTDIACRYLDEYTCTCRDYSHRTTLVPACVTLSPQKVHEYDWLPLTCAYRLLAEGGELRDWHPLVSGNRHSVHDASMSVRYRVMSEKDVPPDEWEERIVQWVL